MYKSFIFSLLVLTAPALAHSQSTTDLRAHLVKFMVTFQGESRRFCSGALLGDDVVLTAGHCEKTIEGYRTKYVGATISVQSELTGDTYLPVHWQQHPVKDMALVSLNTQVTGGVPVTVARPDEIEAITKNPEKYRFAFFKNGVHKISANSFEIPFDSLTYKVNEFTEPNLKGFNFEDYLFLPNVKDGKGFISQGDSGQILFVLTNREWRAFALAIGGALMTPIEALKAKYLNRPPEKALYSRFQTIDLEFIP